MTMPPQKVKVKCPRCRTVYEDWFRPSINLTLMHYSKEEIEEMATVCCPECGRKIWLTSLVVEDPESWLWFESRRCFGSKRVGSKRKMLRRRIRIEWID